MTAGWVRYRTASGSGEYIRFDLRVETGRDRDDHHPIVDIFNIIHTVRDTGIDLKVDVDCCSHSA